MVARARLTEPRVTMEWLLAKPRSFSNLPAFLDLHGRRRSREKNIILLSYPIFQLFSRRVILSFVSDVVWSEVRSTLLNLVYIYIYISSKYSHHFCFFFIFFIKDIVHVRWSYDLEMLKWQSWHFSVGRAWKNTFWRISARCQTILRNEKVPFPIPYRTLI